MAEYFVLNYGVCVFHRKDATTHTLYGRPMAHGPRPTLLHGSLWYVKMSTSSLSIPRQMKTTLITRVHHTQGQCITDNSTGQFLLVAFVLRL